MPYTQKAAATPAAFQPFILFRDVQPCDDGAVIPDALAEFGRHDAYGFERVRQAFAHGDMMSQPGVSTTYGA